MCLYTKSLRLEYTLPSRKNLAETLLPEYYHTIKQKLVSLLNNAHYLSVTTDLWSSDSNKSFITVTGFLFMILSSRAYSVVLATEEITISHTETYSHRVFNNLYHSLTTGNDLGANWNLDFITVNPNKEAYTLCLFLSHIFKGTLINGWKS